MKKDKLKKRKESLETHKMKQDIVQDTEEVSEPQKRKIKIKDTSQKNIEKSRSKKIRFVEDVVDNEAETTVHKKKRKLKHNLENVDTEDVAESRIPTEAELTECNKSENKKDIASKRQQKREKYEKLKADNKVKSEAQMQQKALNYLSQWKHNKNEWKFEKLRQVWIQNHMFDGLSVPNEFWDTVMEYFGGAKGKVRQVLTEDCMKILEENEKEQNLEENKNTKYERARTLLQHLQE